MNIPLNEQQGKTRVLARLTPDEDGYPPVTVEGLWAKDQADGSYVLDSIPFYAQGIAPGDVISVNPSGVDGEKWFSSVLRSGGASIFRIYARDNQTIEQVRAALLDLGCPSEVDAKAGLVALEVPAHSAIGPVLNYLMEGKDASKFDFEEGVLRHTIPE